MGDCKNTGWNMHNEYENALLQKILYINDLITTMQQKANIAKLINTQNHKLMRYEQEEDSTTTLKSLNLKSPKSKSSKTSLSRKTPKSPTMGGPEDETPTKKGKKGKRKMVVAEGGNENGNGKGGGRNEEDDGDFSKESPRKRRKI